MTQKNTDQELLFRLGNVQLLVSWTGEGVHRRPMTKIGKVLPEEVLKLNPNATNEWSMEDLTALEHLCREAKQTMTARQTIDLAALRAYARETQTPPTEGTAEQKANGEEGQ